MSTATWPSCGSTPRMPAGAALVAVGGYGRGELFPLLRRRRAGAAAAGQRWTRPRRRRRATDALRAAVEGFITACWDIGLEIGSSVRTVDECVGQAQRDVTVQTALLESRFLCGSRRVYTAFRQATDAAMDPKAFLRAKTLEMRQRHVEVRGHALLAGAQLQGKPGRPARPAGGDLGGARRRPGPQLDRAGGQGADHALRGRASCSARGHAAS